MTLLVAVLVTVSVSLLVFGLGALLTTSGGSQAIRSRLVDARLARRGERGSPSHERRERIQEALKRVGRRVVKEDVAPADRRIDLVRAGYRGPEAMAIYYGVRIAGAIGLGVFAVLLVSVVGGTTRATVLLATAGVILGWIGPRFFLRSRTRNRQKEIQKALADAIDLLVVCVEAGLGLNQAFQRVAGEVREVSPALAEELEQVNLEIRAGSPRDEALRNLGRRTDLADVRSLVAMLIQTDRFGTSVGKALRVHSDGLRTKRRQRAEEAAAKTTIKLLFPLVLFIFPAMFVVILAPALIHILATLRGL